MHAYKACLLVSLYTCMLDLRSPWNKQKQETRKKKPNLLPSLQETLFHQNEAFRKLFPATIRQNWRHCIQDPQVRIQKDTFHDHQIFFPSTINASQKPNSMICKKKHQMHSEKALDNTTNVFFIPLRHNHPSKG